MNLANAAKVIEFVRALGVLDFCLCAGARNSPFITLLDENRNMLSKQGQLLHFFDERSASFFALGRSQSTKRPVAIVTTSGTAATELISAAVEAYYTQTPLIFITADRPPSYRMTGAPQAINQIGIFTHYSEPTIDLFNNFDLLSELKWNQKKPLHLNVCFDEPLLGTPPPTLQLEPNYISQPPDNQSRRSSNVTLREFYGLCKQPLFVVSGLSDSQREMIALSSGHLEAPIWIEALSGLRGSVALQKNRITSGERFGQYLLSSGFCDGVIRIGGVPTTRIWRDLEDRFKVPVLSLTDSDFSGLARSSFLAPLNDFNEVAQHYNQPSQKLKELQGIDRGLALKISSLIEAHPKSQLNFVRALSIQVGADPLYIGNSLPIREWDFVAQGPHAQAISGNRGANGIDGQLSSFFGWAKPAEHNWALLGDLTTLYDLNAPWVLNQIEIKNWTLAIMNNGGGHIFKPMFGRDAFINRHNTNFKGWAEMWGLTYSCLDEASTTLLNRPTQILELRPCEQQTNSLRAELEKLWKTQLP